MFDEKDLPQNQNQFETIGESNVIFEEEIDFQEAVLFE